MLRHRGAIRRGTFCILFSAVVGGCIDCENMHRMNCIKNSSYMFWLFKQAIIKMYKN